MRYNRSRFALSGSPNTSQNIERRAMGLRRSLVRASWLRHVCFNLRLSRDPNVSPQVTFHDGKNFISKADYAERGPKAVLEMSASLF